MTISALIGFMMTGGLVLAAMALPVWEYALHAWLIVFVFLLAVLAWGDTP